jgi:signal transduction histidine kinase
MTTPESVASLWLTCALVAPVIGASIGWGALWLTSPTPPSVYVLGVWYAADALGIMLLAPLVIGYGRWPEPFPVLRVTTPARVEKLLIMVACICLAFWVFGQPPSSSGTPGKWLVAVAVVLGSWRLSTGEVGVMALGVGCALLGNVPHASLALGSGTVQHRVATSQVILGVLFLAAHVMSVSSSNLRRAELRSRMEKDRIRELSARVAEAEHLERRMISAALHDKVAQPLVAARIKLGLGQAAGDHDERNAILNEVSSILSVALSNSAELLDSVSPSVLYELGIGSALEWLARHYTRPGGALVSAETRNVSKNLPESVAIALYRCARELVSNAVDHSRASSIFVRCRQEPRFLVLEVEDDGEGLPVPSRPAGDAPRTGLGLLAVREQAARVNGVVEVLTRPGNGTLVRLRLPTFMPERAGDERIVRFDASLDGGD